MRNFAPGQESLLVSPTRRQDRGTVFNLWLVAAAALPAPCFTAQFEEDQQSQEQAKRAKVPG